MHGGRALEQLQRDRDSGAGARCTVEVRWSSVIVVQELGARWKCAGAVLRRDRHGRAGALCAVEVRWSSDDGTVMVVKELGARWTCAGAVTKGP